MRKTLWQQRDSHRGFIKACIQFNKRRKGLHCSKVDRQCWNECMYRDCDEIHKLWKSIYKRSFWK